MVVISLKMVQWSYQVPFSYDSNYYSIRIKDEHLGIPVSLYLDQLIGKTLKGQTTGITLKIDSYLACWN